MINPKKPIPAGKFSAHLRDLKNDRLSTKKEHRDKVSRKSLSASLRKEIFNRTNGACHICGGKIKGRWHADHVAHHSVGGPHDALNYLPAHPSCNSARKGFDPEELQWILKLGVWMKTEIEKETALGEEAAIKFCAYETKRISRQKS